MLVFQVWKSCFQHAANGYLVMHSPWGIFDIPNAFLDPENVDFDVLYAILLTFWINFIISYCASGDHLGFSHFGWFPQVFHCGVFLPTHSVLHLHNNFCDTACPASSPILNPHLHNYTIVLSNTYEYAVVYTFKILWHLYLVNNLLIVALYIACWVCQWKKIEILSIFGKDMDISAMSPIYRLVVFCPKL